ncbi:MAG: RluA family pseudouridine synthase [Planctomycetes bacterium]|nr:RluA family pseudouridine synthase [Planctomycetota bacterium]
MTRTVTEAALNEGWIYSHRVAAKDAGASVLSYHAARFPHSTSDEWRESITAGRVVLNGRPAAVDDRLRADDELEFHRPPWHEPAAPLYFDVVYEDKALLVVSKPSGLQVLPAGRFSERTLLQLVRKSDPARAQSSPVHRLGRGTSGLMLFGHTPEARSHLSRQFSARTPCKSYLALVTGTDLPSSAIARHPIGPVPHGPLMLHVARPDGKASTTRVRVVKRDHAAARSLVVAQPVTGRPDQIRIHLAALGAPIVGDPLFGVGGVAMSDAMPGEGGYFLHATGLRCVHPETRRWIKFRLLPHWI